MRTAPALKFALLLALGILLGDHLPSVSWLLLLLAGAGMIVLGIFALRLSWGDGPVCLALLVTGVLLGWSSRLQPVTPGDGDIYLSGKILSRIDIRDDRAVFLFRPEWSNPAGTPLVKGGWGGSDLRLVTSPDSRLQPGTEMLVRGQVNPYPAQRNPGGRDWQADFLRQGIVGWIKPDTFIIVQSGHPGWQQSLRDKFSRLLASALPPPQATLASSMILGDRGLLPENVDDDFRRSGLYHLLVVSGSNIGCLLVVLVLLVGPFSLSLRLRRLIMIAGVWFYAALTGWQPPTLRAALMITLVLASYEVWRVPRPWNSLGAAAVILLLWSPQQLFQPGFQLSFAAMAGVLFAADINSNRERSRPELPPRSRKLVRFFRQKVFLPLLASVCVVAFTAPILTAHFGGFAPAAVLWNLPAMPLTGAIFSLTWLVLILKGLFGISLAVLNSSLELALKGLESLAAWGSALPGNSSGQYGGLAVAVILAAAVAGYFLLRRGQKRLLWAGGSLAVVLFLPLTYVPAYFEVEFLDVGQGDATLLRFPDGQQVLIDTGDEKAARFELLPALKRQGVNRLSDLIISHFDRDHCGGVPDVMKSVAVDRLLVNELEPEDDLGKLILKTARAVSIPIKVLALGDTLGGLPGTRCLTLWPPRNFAPKDDNAQSLVLRVSYGQTDVLFTGDLPSPQEKALLAAGSYLQSEILKVAHHGSSKSSCRAFLETVKPQWALIGVGKNRYGHPTARVLSDLKAVGAIIHRTDRDGAGLWRSDGKTAWEVQWR